MHGSRTYSRPRGEIAEKEAIVMAKKKRSAKQKANDRRLGVMARARAKSARGGARKSAKRRKTSSGRKKPRSAAQKAATLRMLAARGVSPRKASRKGRKKSGKIGTLAQKKAELRMLRGLLAAEKRKGAVVRGGFKGGAARHRAQVARAAGKSAIVTAMAVRSGSPTSEIRVPAQSVVHARTQQIARTPNQHGKRRQPGHAPVSVLLRRIALLELDILKRVEARDVDSDRPYVSKKDPPEIKAFLRR
jgi:hypothetical protein